MWIEEVTLENVKCFQSQTIRLGEDGKPYPWVTFLGENGTGKTTVLQALGWLLAGEEGVKKLGFWHEGWIRTKGNDANRGSIKFRPRADKHDEGQATFESFLEDLQARVEILISPENEIMANSEFNNSPNPSESHIFSHRIDDWLMRLLSLTLHTNLSRGWFSAGYGSFRRLSKENRILVPNRMEYSRHTNFLSLFKEDQPLEAFETWIIYLDYLIAKNKDETAEKHLEIAKSAINSLLPEGNTIEGADIDGKVYFHTPQGRVPTIALSDGFRSILALAGDLIWRMIQAFPESENPLNEQGVVLIDEIDIHLHPKWQRSIAGLLRSTFPNVQFIVATHSPIVAAGAGHDAVTYGFYQEGDQTKVERIEHVWAQSVDDILTSRAFGLVSEFSEETQAQIDTYLKLRDKKKRSKEDEARYQQTIPFVREALGPGMEKTPLELEIDAYIKEHVK
jgi:AAA domain, putative AbiEii toxin, Type IV TA system